MLRITRAEDRGTSVIRVRAEGRVISDWVAVLERECQMALAQAQRVEIDLSGVTFIDGRGVEMLRRLRAGRLGIVNCSPFLEDLLSGGGDR